MLLLFLSFFLEDLEFLNSIVHDRVLKAPSIWWLLWLLILLLNLLYEILFFLGLLYHGHLSVFEGALELGEIFHPLTYGLLGGRVKWLFRVTTFTIDGRLRLNKSFLSKWAHLLCLLDLSLLEVTFSLHIRGNEGRLRGSMSHTKSGHGKSLS